MDNLKNTAIVLTAVAMSVVTAILGIIYGYYVL